MSRKDHWEYIHATKGDAVSWHQPTSTLSLDMVRSCALQPGSKVVDVGAGASILVEALLDLDFNPTVLDIAEAALARVRERLGSRSAQVKFIASDITQATLPDAEFDLWHDRAVFHFLTDPEDRAAYLATLKRSLKPGGHLILAAFAPEGPEKCSGLTVCRYDAAGFATELGPGFTLLEEAREDHPTPFGTHQAFIYARFKKA